MEKFYYEDGIKQPYISTSVKRLVLASYAQFGVSAGYEEIMGDRNGIRQPFHFLAET